MKFVDAVVFYYKVLLLLFCLSLFVIACAKPSADTVYVPVASEPTQATPTPEKNVQELPTILPVCPGYVVICKNKKHCEIIKQ